MEFNNLTLEELENINGGWDPDAMEKQAKTALAIWGVICGVGQETHDSAKGLWDGFQAGTKAGSY